MKPDIVYIHTGFDPTHTNSLWVAIYSAQRLLSELQIRCVVPADELSELKRISPAILKGQIEWVPVEVPPGNPVYRSRWIKTQLVKWLSGPSLYLDSDTLVVESPNWAELSSFTFAAALNRVSDHNFNECPCRINATKLFAAAGWEWMAAFEGFYKNSGVMYIVPGRQTESIFSAWHQKWLEFLSLTGSYLDQPALNTVLLKHDWSERLPDHWNAPVRVLPGTHRGAYIQHYYSSSSTEESSQHTLFGRLVELMDQENFDLSLVDKWLSRKRVYVAMGARIRGYMLAGQYLFMLRSVLNKVLRQILNRVN
jgi:hypothetical protein